jgi:hypothetical protein
MMDFPTSPTAGTIVTFPNGQSYRWNGGQWDIINQGQPRSAWELIEDKIATSVLGYDIHNLDPFEFIKITGSLHLDSASLNSNFVGYMSANNGTSYFTGATDYWYQQDYGSGSTAGAGTGNFGSLILSAGQNIIGTPNSAGLSFVLTLFRFNKTGYTRGKLELSVQVQTTGVMNTTNMNVGCSQTVAMNAISLQTNQPYSGHFIVEGIRG